MLYQKVRLDNAIYTIRSGLIKLVLYLPDCWERIIRLMKATDSIELERIPGSPYDHTAIVLKDVTACRIPIGVLQQLDEEKPRFYRKMMARWATTLFQDDDYIMLQLAICAKSNALLVSA